MQYFCLFFIFTLVGLSKQELKLYNIRQLTLSGKHSQPKFSADNRYVYFSANSGDYGKECDEIYRLDLKYADKLNDPNRISKVSPGLGQSTSSSTNNVNSNVAYVSTFEKAVESQNTNFDLNNHMCPKSKCSENKPPASCSKNVYVEHFFDTYIYSSSSTQALQRQQDNLALSTYHFSPSQTDSFTSYVKDCSVRVQPWDGSAPYDTGSTCLFINDKKPFNEEQGLALYYDYFSMGKETETGKVRFAYQKTRYSTQNLPDSNVFSLNFADVYEGVLEADGTIKNEYSIRYCEPNYSTSTLWPSTLQDGKKPGTLYTAVEATGNRSIKACFGGFDSQQVTDLGLNAMQGSARNDYKQIVYVQQDGNAEYQLYIADLVNGLKTNFNSKPLVKAVRKVNDNLNLASYIELNGQLGRVRLTKQLSHVYFERNSKSGINCKQLYHVDTQFNDFSSPRLISTNIGSIDGFDIYEENSNQKIVYSSDFMQTKKNNDKDKVHKCYATGCDIDDAQKSSELKTFCASKSSTKYLGNDFDLYLANIYGNIEKRITNNKFYEGQVTIDRKNSRIYYSKVSLTDLRVDIAYRSFSDLNTETVVTKDLPIGYYAGVTIATDDLILYHAYKPQGNADINEFKKFLKDYQVVDTSKLQIYGRYLSKNVDFQITNLNGQCSNPVYTPQGTVLYQTNFDQDATTKSSIYEVKLDRKDNKVVLKAAPGNSRSLSFGTKEDLVFVSDGSDSKSNAIWFANYKASKTPDGGNTGKAKTVSTPRPRTSNDNSGALQSIASVFLTLLLALICF